LFILSKLLFTYFNRLYFSHSSILEFGSGHTYKQLPRKSLDLPAYIHTSSWDFRGNCLYVCALLKIAASYQHSHKIFHPWSIYKILIKRTFRNFTLWMTLDVLGCPGAVASFIPPLHIPGNNIV